MRRPRRPGIYISTRPTTGAIAKARSSSALVDVVGDEDYEQSCLIDFEPELERKGAPKLLASLEAILPYAEGEAYSLDKHTDSPEAEAEAVRAWNAIEAAQAIVAEAHAIGIVSTPSGVDDKTEGE